MQKPKWKQLTGHTAPVYSLAVTPDGKRLLSAGFDHTVRLWDLETGQLEQTLRGHDRIVLAVAVSPDGTRAASGSLDETIKIWNIASGEKSSSKQAKKDEQPLANLGGHGARIYDVTFSPDGQWLASASADKTVRLWDLTENKQAKTLSQQPEPVYSVEFSGDGQHLLTAGADKTVRLIKVEDGSVIRQYNGPNHPVYVATFGPKSQRVAAAGVGMGETRSIYLWSVESIEASQVLEGDSSDIYQVQFHPGGNRLLTAAYAGRVRIWNLNTAEVVHSLDLPSILYSAVYLKNGRQVAVAAENGSIYLIDLPEEAC